MIGDAGLFVGLAGAQRHVAQEVGDVMDAAGEADASGRLVLQLECVVAHDGAAARGCCDDGVEGLRFFECRHFVDQCGGAAFGGGGLAQMMVQRAATAGALDGRDFEAVAREDADRSPP